MSCMLLFVLRMGLVFFHVREEDYRLYQNLDKLALKTSIRQVLVQSCSAMLVLVVWHINERHARTNYLCCFTCLYLKWQTNIIYQYRHLKRVMSQWCNVKGYSLLDGWQLLVSMIVRKSSKVGFQFVPVGPGPKHIMLVTGLWHAGTS